MDQRGHAGAGDGAEHPVGAEDIGPPGLLGAVGGLEEAREVDDGVGTGEQPVEAGLLGDVGAGPRRSRPGAAGAAAGDAHDGSDARVRGEAPHDARADIARCARDDDAGGCGAQASSAYPKRSA